MAVSFFTETNLRATVFLSGESFFLLCSLPAPNTGAAFSFAEDFGAEAVLAFWAERASSLLILPPTPDPCTAEAAIPFSANILAAAGEGWPAA